jgi:hypothetical protein
MRIQDTVKFHSLLTNDADQMNEATEIASRSAPDIDPRQHELTDLTPIGSTV